ncbi:hypothetical protein H0H81_001655 [Sphagnurus paluster]|uniref:Uncharacterized protein n=1 Tax=Sphagnurus paluster TaxID=117069 RepID=A0A9P7FVV8_9AGAR|nr:hypothetical protein H0H81_001655 [Sphagnurus paluster]
MKSFTTTDPRVGVSQSVVSTPTPPVAAPPPVPAAMDPQATLLALLAQAANAATVPTQTTANTSVTGLDAAQLAVLQQLALAQTASSAAPSQPAPSQALPAQSGSAFPTSSSNQEERFNSHLKERRFNGPQSSDRVNAYNDQPDDRPSAKGGFRGGFRGRGRGRWDDRDRDRYRERDRDDSCPSYRGRRSRSRSPPNRNTARRDVRPYSPPRRPNFPSKDPRARDNADNGLPSGDSAGKDEFGRDIRPQSPASDATPTPTSPPKREASKSPLSPAPTPFTPTQPFIATQPAVDASSFTSNHDPMSLSESPSIAANTSSRIPSAPIISSIVPEQSGLESFNATTFDFTSPKAWESLGNMWQDAHGYLPSAEELMQFVIAGGQAAFTTSTSTPVPAPAPVQGHGHGWQNQAWRGRGRGGFSGGRGGMGYGSTRVSQDEWGQAGNNQETDAIVLGGGTETEMEVEKIDQNHSSGGGTGGRMQRIGEKWVFVRDPVAA